MQSKANLAAADSSGGSGSGVMPEPFRYPEGTIVGPCACGSWPGGKCLRCPPLNFYTMEQMEAVLGTRDCGNEDCGWRGTTDRFCGTVGPLCPECGEVTE